MDLAMVRGIMLGQDKLLVSMQKMKVHLDNGRRMTYQVSGGKHTLEGQRLQKRSEGRQEGHNKEPEKPDAQHTSG
ncbi:hypothetical protein CRG98_034319 [Punica granatum]|uniref:Uncharacterized protein n=1 Tax=Punica granatum TaxID=22663 RepID=A0A2I0INM0_PUNGR|nr:hypothetical protein CRG98_034319 [Punica granatum]